MIVRPKPKFFELLFLLKGSILRHIAPQLTAIFLFSIAMVLILPHLHNEAGRILDGFRAAPFTLLGIAISIFLGFRNNACYDRWWEARRQLGQMIGEMRSLARLATNTLQAPEPILRTAIAFTYALNTHLRREPGASSPTVSRNPPDQLLRQIAADTTQAYRSGEITDNLYKIFDDRLSTIANIQVACERIASTPTPFTYTLLLHRTAYLFCFLLPVSLAPTLGYATPIFCTLIAYTFFGLDALGDELEEPFGDHANSLPLDALSRIIEISILEALGDPNPPPYLQPIDHELR